MSDCRFGVSPVNCPDPDQSTVQSYRTLTDLKVFVRFQKKISAGIFNVEFVLILRRGPYQF